MIKYGYVTLTGGSIPTHGYHVLIIGATTRWICYETPMQMYEMYPDKITPIGSQVETWCRNRHVCTNANCTFAHMIGDDKIPFNEVIFNPTRYPMYEDYSDNKNESTHVVDVLPRGDKLMDLLETIDECPRCRIALRGVIALAEHLKKSSRCMKRQ